MSLSQREIGLATRALGELAGGVVQKIQLCAPLRLFIELRRPGQSDRLFVCGESGATRLHLSWDKESSPARPLAFQGLLRAHLTGTRLTEIEQLVDERAVTLTFQGRDCARRLVAELTGRHGNFFLLDDAGKILGLATPSASTRRDLRVGATYQPPLPVTRGEGTERPARFEGLRGAEAISRAIEATYRAIEADSRREAERQARLKPLRAELKRTERAIERASGDLQRCGAAEDELRRGNLLKANQHLIARGQREARLVEYTPEGAREVTLQLDPALTPQQEIEAAFRRYRRWTSGREKAAARIAALEERLRAIEARLAAVEAVDAKGEAAGVDLDVEGMAGGRHRPKPTAPGDREARTRGALPFREFMSAAGQRVWVGRSARHNDALTFKCAKGNDLWLHVRGLSGSHVVIPLKRGEEASEETLRDACQLARHFSSARAEAAEVSWTRVKFVRRQKGGAPGAVTYSQERTRLIRPDKKRLSRLLGEPFADA